jgi:uncharacterized BrkB/YihY/UPF0761 family membrane protein
MDPAQTFTLGLPLTLAAAVALPVIRNYIRSWVTALLVEIGRWPIPFAFVTLALAVLYRCALAG